MLDHEVYESKDLDFIRQRCFDCAYEQILLQEGIGYSAELGSCAYYHEGNRCAVGWLLPEEVAMSLSDYTGSATSSRTRDILESLFYNLSPHDFDDLITFLRTLQREHDRAVDLGLNERKGFFVRFSENLKGLARDYGLNTYVLEETDA